MHRAKRTLAEVKRDAEHLVHKKDGTIGFRMGFLYGLKAFTAAVLGGIGNIQGAVVGGIALGIVEAFATNLFPSDWKDVWAFGLLIVFLVFRPQGIMGARVVDRA